MTAARRFAAANCRAADHFVVSLDAMNCRAVDHLVASLEAENCRAADHFVASLDAGLNHDPVRASRRASTRADRCVAEYHRFEAGQFSLSRSTMRSDRFSLREGASSRGGLLFSLSRSDRARSISLDSRGRGVGASTRSGRL
jgi:hypothetical protein